MWLWIDDSDIQALRGVDQGFDPKDALSMLIAVPETLLKDPDAVECKSSARKRAHARGDLREVARAYLITAPVVPQVPDTGAMVASRRGFALSQEKEIVLAYVDAFNRGDVDAVCRLFAPDALIGGVFGWGTVEQACAVWKDLIECLQIQLQVDGIIAEGNTVAARYTERGKSVRAFRGAGPTGRSYELTAMEWFEIKDGLICRRWGARDSATQNRQLGFESSN